MEPADDAYLYLTLPLHHIYKTEKMSDATSQSIPVVDLSSPTAAKDLLHAAVTFGFIFVKRTDDLPLKPQDVDDMFSLVRAVTCLPVVLSLPARDLTLAMPWQPLGRHWTMNTDHQAI